MPEQTFKTVDVLRLEVETDPTGLVNLVQNPSGELGGWGWITPITGSKMERYVSYTALSYTGNSTIGDAENFYTEPMPITAGQYAAASLNAVTGSSGDYFRVRFEWLDTNKNLLSSSTQSAYTAVNAGVVTYGSYQAPASTVYMRLRFDCYDNNTGTNPGAFNLLIFKEVTVAKAAAALGTTTTNLVRNPSFEVDTSDWVNHAGSALSRSNAVTPHVGSWVLRQESTSAFATWYEVRSAQGLSAFPVLGGHTYNVSAYARAATTPRTAQVGLSFWDASGSLLGEYTGGAVTTTTSSWTRSNFSFTPPATATRAAVRLRISASSGTIPVGEVHYWDAVQLIEGTAATSYFDGATTDTAGVTYDWTGTAHASSSTRVADSLSYVEPVQYLNIAGEVHGIGVTREELNVGTLNATVISSALDPSQEDLLRPGRRCRLTALSGGVWSPVFTGKVSNAKVTYELKDPTIPEERRARIELTALDNVSALAQVSRPQGVGTIASLPWVLEGAGVPWNVNGSGSQVGSATVVSNNENATAIDQLAITRDSVNGYAWVDRYGVAQAWDAAQIGTTGPTWDEDHYSGLEVDWDSDRCINSVTVKYLRYGTADQQTTEIAYGPYENSSSITTWGRHAAEFTVHGITETAGNIQTFANAVLAANATPAIRVNSVTLPIADTADIGHALTDLYALATLSNTRAGITNAEMRVTGIQHEITADKWLVHFEFAHDGGVAAPQVSPPVQNIDPPPFGLVAGYVSASTASIANSTFTKVLGWTVVQNNIYGGINGSGDLTITYDGTYTVNIGATFASNATGRRVIALFVGANEVARLESAPNSTWTGAVTWMGPLTAGDVLSIRVFQTSGAGLALSATPGHRWELLRIGPK